MIYRLLKTLFFSLLLVPQFSVGQSQYWSYTHDCPASGNFSGSKFFHAQPIASGGALCVGGGFGPNFTAGGLVQRIDSNGTPLWTASVPSIGGGFYGQTQSAWLDSQRLLIGEWQHNIALVDLQGNVEWTDTLPMGPGMGGQNGATRMLELLVDDNHNMMFGINEWVPDQAAGVVHPRILIMDSSRQILLDTTYLGITGFDFKDLIQTRDGNYIFVGLADTTYFSAPRTGLRLVKFDINGNILWSNGIVFGFTINFIGDHNLCEAPDGSLTVVGNSSAGMYMDRFDEWGMPIFALGASFPVGWKVGEAFTASDGNLLVLISLVNMSQKVALLDTAGAILWQADLPYSSSAPKVYDIAENSRGFLAVGQTTKNQQSRGYALQLNRVGTLDHGVVSGRVHYDTLLNCIQDSGAYYYPGSLVKIEPGPIYTTINVQGEFAQSLDSGNYYVSYLPPPMPWKQVCPTSPDSHFVMVDSSQSTFSGLDFEMHPTAQCAYMVVNIGTPRVSQCRNTTYQIQCTNLGTQIATNAYIDLEVDSLLTVQSFAGLPSTQIGPHTYRLQVGNMAPFDVVHATMLVTASCSLAAGRTACVRASAYPQEYCEPSHPGWDSASIAVSGRCIQGDTVEFRITNVGTANMNMASGILIAEDDVLRQSGTVQLNAGQDSVIKIKGNGSTWSLVVNQVPYHPGSSHPRAIVEACGLNSSSSFSIGHVMTLPADDQDHFVDIECHMILGSFDPNDKRGLPLGTGVQHLIAPNQDLEYHIRFQNTGTDTAYSVVVRDQLPPELDLSTFRPGVSSHPYTFNILPGNVLEWSFLQIMLPDSGANEPASNGFLKFHISQNVDLPPGTRLRNAADIFFDYNPAIVTDTAWHTIADSVQGVLLVEIDPPAIADQAQLLLAYPNPFRESVTLAYADASIEGLRLEVFDMQGRLLREQISAAGHHQLVFRRENLADGVYFFRLWSGDRMLGSGKLVAR